MQGSFCKKRPISKNQLLYCGLLVLFSAVCYMRVLGFGFLILDDPIYVTENTQVRQGLTLETIKWAFSSIEEEFWHPLTWISLMIDSTLYGLLPRGFHSTNLFLHMGATIFLFLCFNLMTGQIHRSFILAAIFAVHPLHVEAVAWIAERKEVLCGFFWCTALYAYSLYAKKPGPARYLAVLALFCLGLMSKPMIITLPFVLLLIDFWPLKRWLANSSKSVASSGDRKIRISPLLIEKIPFFVFMGAAVWANFYAQKAGQGIVGLEIYPFSARLANALLAYPSYLFKTIFPFNLSIFYPFRMNLPVVKVIGSASALLIATWIVLIRWKKQPYLFVGWFWFLGTLVPVIGFVKIGDFAMADRYMYMPIVGVLLLGVWLGADFFDQPFIPKAVPAIMAIGFFLLCTTNTLIYIDKWENNEKLFQHAASVSSPNYFAHYALGNVYAGKGRYVKAEGHFQAAVAMRPDKIRLRLDLGRIMGVRSRFTDASSQFLQVLQKKDDHREAHFYMGLSLMGTNQFSSALDHFISALNGRILKSKNMELLSKLETLRRKGEHQLALELIGIKCSEDFIKKLFAKGYDSWRYIGH